MYTTFSVVNRNQGYKDREVGLGEVETDPDLGELQRGMIQV